MAGGAVRLASKKSPEFSSSITVDSVKYLVQTEDMGEKTCRITSRVYKNGEVVFSRDSDYSHLLKLDPHEEQLLSMMETQHRATIDFFVKAQASRQKQKSAYFEEVRELLRYGNGAAAFSLLEEALDVFPADPFLMTYYGCLTAVVAADPLKGISICLNAINALNETIPFGSEFFHPVFYLNLGRAYLQNSQKKEALASFRKGMKGDPDNQEIHQELVKLGCRRRLPVPFLRRSNPINKYIGLLLSKREKKEEENS